MNYIKHLIKTLLFVQCFLLFCVCDKKEIVTTEQNKLNLADFIKWPFNEELDDNTDLEKYVLKKFGKPDSIRKWRDWLGDHSEVVADKIELLHKDYAILIYKWVFKRKRFEVFKSIAMTNYTDLKYGINNETTIKDIERLFGKPDEIQNIQREKSDARSDVLYYYYVHEDSVAYVYSLGIGFRKGRYRYISVTINISL